MTGVATTGAQGHANGCYFITRDGRLVGGPGLSHAEVIAQNASLQQPGGREQGLQTIHDRSIVPLPRVVVAAGNTRITVVEDKSGPEVSIEAPSREALNIAVNQVRVDLPSARIAFDITLPGGKIVKSGTIPPGAQGDKSKTAQARAFLSGGEPK